jgi:hypothetical protein
MTDTTMYYVSDQPDVMVRRTTGKFFSIPAQVAEYTRSSPTKPYFVFDVQHPQFPMGKTMDIWLNGTVYVRNYTT